MIPAPMWEAKLSSHTAVLREQGTHALLRASNACRRRASSDAGLRCRLHGWRRSPQQLSKVSRHLCGMAMAWTAKVLHLCR
jgi:hypothetical protein